jgi:iron-regulated transporter 1
MSAYLLQNNISTLVVAFLRGIGVVIGILATISFPIITGKIGATRYTLWSIYFELVFLGIACYSFFVKDQILSFTMLLGGVSISRFGLWSFDMGQTQILQTKLHDDLGSLSGIQISLQSFFDLMAYIATAYWSTPDEFWIPSMISFGAVCLSALIYTFFSYKDRGHLFHFSYPTPTAIVNENTPLLNE